MSGEPISGEPTKLTTKEKVHSQIDEYREEYGSGWGGHFFNTFRLLLPFSDESKAASARYLFENSLKNSANTPFNEYLKDPKEKEGLSDLKLSQTPIEFLDAIEKTIPKAGLSVEEIKERQKDEEIHQDLYEYIIPLYIKLLEMGYVPKDLTGE